MSFECLAHAWDTVMNSFENLMKYAWRMEVRGRPQSARFGLLGFETNKLDTYPTEPGSMCWISKSEVTNYQNSKTKLTQPMDIPLQKS